MNIHFSLAFRCDLKRINILKIAKLLELIIKWLKVQNFFTHLILNFKGSIFIIENR